MAVTFETVQRFCLELPGTTEDLKWGCNLVFSVGEKMYAVWSVEKDASTRISFKADPELYQQLIQQDGVIPAPYLARAQWVAFTRLDALPEDSFWPLLRDAYQIIFNKLSKKKQRAILEA